MTNAARHFFKPAEMPAGVTNYSDELEWRAWSKKGDPVLHIELRKWADVFLIAPLSANTLAKLATGLCDNLLVRSITDFSSHECRQASLVHGTFQGTMKLYVVTVLTFVSGLCWSLRR